MHRLLLKALFFLFMVVPISFHADKTPAAEMGAFRLPPAKPGRPRPLIAIVADNAGTETTDLMVPYGVLKEADVADVVIVSTHPGPVTLMPALTIQPDMTMRAFDAIHPDGADIVIVPALHDDKNESVINWVREQAHRHAFIASICEGAWVAARAGVLDGRAATTHWYALAKIARTFPRIVWVRDRRYVVDRNVMTTTGVSASIPASLALIEALAGRARAESAAATIGGHAWKPTHDTSRFRLTAGHVWTVTKNALSPWRHEMLSIPATNDFDEIALALTADAWSRTYRSQAIIGPSKGLIRSRHGLILLPDAAPANKYPQLSLPRTRPTQALDEALTAIASRYGNATADLVALQLEYGRNDPQMAN
ncbi:DJ-1/PfpI family protein [Labrys sp. LIt4]|uniref:DJ-1/PfpI family protein n=1 Tax=Labrys sp. LIt4 TaxID=2821355 RepID=UPI001ADF5149|nr:DJ-1/PfpI family protein [Labrys sp. LIt4]MBP0582811.1 DJ-1/PfpI family protein [Labrys sp. LIt4]